MKKLKTLIIAVLLICIIQIPNIQTVNRTDIFSGETSYKIDDTMTYWSPAAQERLEEVIPDTNTYIWQLAFSYLGSNKRCYRVVSDFWYDYYGQALYSGINDEEITREELQPGDAVYYEWDNTDETHLVVYLGDGYTLSGNTYLEKGITHDGDVWYLDYEMTAVIDTLEQEHATTMRFYRYKKTNSTINVACEYHEDFGYEDVKGTAGCDSLENKEEVKNSEIYYNNLLDEYTNIPSLYSEWQDKTTTTLEILYYRLFK